MNDAATIGHNSAAVGEILAAEPAAVFREPDMLNQLQAEIEAEIEALDSDVSTLAGRKAIASLAHAIARRKSALDAAGKALNEDRRKAINAVDEIRRDLRDRLDALKSKARAPLDAYEAAEAEREARVAAILQRLNAARTIPMGATAAQLRSTRADIAELEIGADLDVAGQLTSDREDVIDILERAIVELDAREAEAAELARLREAEVLREREAEAQRQRDAAEAAEAERIRHAEERAAEAARAEERRKAEAAERQREAQETARLKAERDRAEAAEAALSAAREKAAAEAREQAAREANQKHRAMILDEAAAAIAEQSGLSRSKAEKLALAIAAHSIPHVSIRF